MTIFCLCALLCRVLRQGGKFSFVNLWKEKVLYTPRSSVDSVSIFVPSYYLLLSGYHDSSEKSKAKCCLKAFWSRVSQGQAFFCNGDFFLHHTCSFLGGRGCRCQQLLKGWGTLSTLICNAARAQGIFWHPKSPGPAARVPCGMRDVPPMMMSRVSACLWAYISGEIMGHCQGPLESERLL